MSDLIIVGQILQVCRHDTLVVRGGDVLHSHLVVDGVDGVDGVDVDPVQLAIHSVEVYWFRGLNIALEYRV